MHTQPAGCRFFICCKVQFSHARIQCSQYPRGIDLLRQRFQRADPDHGYILGKRQPLSNTTGNSQPGKGTRTRSKSDAIDLIQSDAGFSQQGLQHRQQQLGMALASQHFPADEVAVQP